MDYLLCEDTRKTINLLKKLKQPGENIPILISYFEENELNKTPGITRDLKKGLNIGIVSNAGTPTLSDPGFKLIRECVKENIKIIPIPGPSSVTAAISASGLPTDRFMFLGFLPSKQSHRRKLIINIKSSLEIIPATIVFFESPFRIVKTLNDLRETFGDIEIVVAREMTKIYEEFKKEKISDMIDYLRKGKEKGEFVILFHL